MDVPLLELRNICKRFGDTRALCDVSLTLQSGRNLALVGENGAGKSTLMKILSGVYQPDSGSILLDGQAVRLRDPRDARQRGISIIHQEFSLVPHLDVTDNLFLGREPTNRIGMSCRSAMRRQAQRVLDRLGATFSIDSIVARLGIAQQQFVEIAKALLGETRVLIMDEPTATLTVAETRRLLSIMRELVQQGVSIIFISHHLEEVFDVADDVLCLRDGARVGFGHSAELSQDELIRMMVGRDLNTTFPPAKAQIQGGVVLDVHALQRKSHLPTVSFQLRAGEILGLAGLVGSGRSKMVHALVGADRATQRELSLNQQRLSIRTTADARTAGIGLIPEDRKRQGLVLDASIRDNMVLASLKRLCHPVLRLIRRRAVVRATNQQAEQLRIKAASLSQLARALSGGNQQKIVLAKWLLADCQVLILDEPTRGIDIGAKGEIYQLLRELRNRGVAILLISSELPEVIGMSDRLMVMRNQRIEHTFESRLDINEEAVMNYAAGVPSA
ncbi:MAG: sugar ABC transporter ATP-binding protein [Pirellulaceae bacterium]|nr:sugar ABC transporter ATP-binding protein [Pirellulaceae bacterium]